MANYKIITENRRHSLVLAVKAEPEDHEPGRIILEQKVLSKLKGTKNIPTFYASGNYNGFNFIVMQMLGKNLSELRKRQPKRCMSAGTVGRVGQQCAGALSAMHEIGFIHRDVKPSNYCIGLEQQRRTVYLVDFGMARQYRLENGIVRKERYYAGFRGTMRYVSVTVHERRDQGPVDDLWSLLYSLIELLVGTLPWCALNDPEHIAKRKKNIQFEEYGRSVPIQLSDYVDHLTELKFEQLPDYKLLNDILKKCLPKNVNDDTPYDWEDQDEKTNDTEMQK